MRLQSEYVKHIWIYNCSFITTNSTTKQIKNNGIEKSRLIKTTIIKPWCECSLWLHSVWLSVFNFLYFEIYFLLSFLYYFYAFRTTSSCMISWFSMQYEHFSSVLKIWFLTNSKTPAHVVCCTALLGNGCQQ